MPVASSEWLLSSSLILDARNAGFIHWTAGEKSGFSAMGLTQRREPRRGRSDPGSSTSYPKMHRCPGRRTQVAARDDTRPSCSCLLDCRRALTSVSVVRLSQREEVKCALL